MLPLLISLPDFPMNICQWIIKHMEELLMRVSGKALRHRVSLRDRIHGPKGLHTDIVFLEAEDLRRWQMSSCGLGERRSALKSLTNDGIASELHHSAKESSQSLDYSRPCDTW
ncbi:hypothetical protein KC330_g181 [Hortaea werneckii]|nr:hypothetical protein KC330_g181 [Hortaea werneckii]